MSPADAEHYRLAADHLVAALAKAAELRLFICEAERAGQDVRAWREALDTKLERMAEIAASIKTAGDGRVVN